MASSKRQASIESLHTAASILDKSPSRPEYDDLGLSPSSSTITREFGSWNEAKDAANLEQYSQEDGGGHNGILPKPSNVELPDGTVWEELSPAGRWYYRNREAHSQTVRERVDKLHRKLTEWLRDSETRCEKCGLGHPGALQLHHTDDNEYSICLRDMANDGYSWDTIQNEISLGEVLCANCHNIHHYQTMTGKWSAAKNSGM